MQKTLIMATLLVASIPASGQTPRQLQVKQLTLSNGMEVWLNEDHSQPKVFGAVVVKAGAADCPNTGIAHYFEHILFKGTDRLGTVDYQAEKPWLDSIASCYDKLAQTKDSQQRLDIQKDINRLSAIAGRYAIPNEFNSLISRYGGSGLNASTGYDATTFYNTFTPQYLRQWAMLNSERLIHPVFRLFQGELETVYEEKNMYSDNLLMPAMEKVIGTLFKDTPYEYPIIGSTDNLKNPSLRQMQDFYNKYYVAGNMVLILAGDLRSDSIVPLLENTFGRIRSGKAPERESFEQKPFDPDNTVGVKIPFPLIKAVAHIYRAPNEDAPDNITLDIAMSLLSNKNQTGLIDSLVNTHKILLGIGTRTAMKRAGAIIIGAIPKIPFGSKRKAERLCMEQVERLKRGDFSEAALEQAKQEILNNLKIDTEDLSKRTRLMIGIAGSSTSTWDDFLKRTQSVSNVTKEDIIRVTNKYMGNNYLRLVKKFGMYSKDRVSQPGYKPVVPQNRGAESDFAKMLDTLPTKDIAPRFVDFNKDVATTPLGNLATLYSTANPVNDIFTLELIYHKGKLSDPRLEFIGEYLPEIGTDSLSKQDYGKALRKLDSTVDIISENNMVKIRMTGLDRNLSTSLRLLGHFLDHMKADPKKDRDMRQSYAMERRAFDKSYDNIAQAASWKVAFGEKSFYYNRLTKQELKELSGDSIIHLFNDLRRTECSVAYSGNLAADSVAAYVKEYLKPSLSSEEAAAPYTERLNVDKPTVYIYQAPNARQNVIVSYTPLPKTNNQSKRAIQSLWGRYFGGGMSSVTFQELREFRSFAYYAYGSTYRPNPIRHPDGPTYYTVTMGTQADKTSSAVDVLDSLLNDMPYKEKSIELAKQEMINNINNSYPSFRDIGEYVANKRAAGYTEDPDKTLYKALLPLTPADAQSYYDKNVRNAARAWIVVGKVSKKDIEHLAKYGEIKMLERKDIVKF